MRPIYPLVIAGAALTGLATPAFAQMGGGNTTRPSYDMPRAYDRDAYGNETYRYHSSPDYSRHVKRWHHRHHHHYNYD